MTSRDKIEPFWAPLGRRLRGPMFRIGPRPAPPVDEKPRRARAQPEIETAGAPDDRVEPLPPALPISAARRRETIAALIADQIAYESHPTPPPAPPVEDRDPVMTLRGERLLDPPPPPAPPLPGPAPPVLPLPHAAPEANAAVSARPAETPQGWVRLSEEAAAGHRLYGIGGGMALVTIFIVLGIVGAAVELVDFWTTVDHGGLSAWIMALFRSAMALWAVLNLGLLLAHSRAFPGVYGAYTAINIVYLAMFALAFAHITRGAVFKFVAAMIVLNLVAWLYVALSARANVTFLRRVRSKGQPA